MSEIKKELVENLVKGDSAKADVKKQDLTVQYVKATELTPEEISKLPKGRVIMKKVEGTTKSGDTFKNFSLTLELCPGSVFVVDNKKFKESDFYGLAIDIFYKKYNDSLDLNVYDRKFPIRFLKGSYKNKDGEVNEYHMIQIIFKVGVVYSVIVRKQNRELETLLLNEEIGRIEKINWVVKNEIVDIVTNGEIDDSKLYE